MIDRIPPQDLTTERVILASMLIDRTACDVGLELLRGDSFYASSNKAVFEAISRVVAASGPIDAITVGEDLKKHGQLEAEGVENYINFLLNDIASAHNIEAHCAIILQKELLRGLININHETTSSAFEPDADAKGLVDSHAAKIFALSDRRQTGQLETAGAILPSVFDEIERFQRGIFDGVIKTGLTKLDESTGGLGAGELIIIAGRPGSGKSALAGQIALNLAKTGIGSATFSLEMTKKNYVQRIICSEAGVDVKRCRSGQLTKSELNSLGLAAGPIYSMPIHIDDTPSINVMEIRAKSRRIIAKKNVKAIIIDYLQMIQPLEKLKVREQEVSATSRALKILSKETGLPVIALAQLSRANEQRSDHRPILSDLRESGAIEQDADMVIFTHRPWVYSHDDSERNIAELIIAKQRNGPIGTVRVSFIDHLTRFSDLEEKVDKDNGIYF